MKILQLGKFYPVRGGVEKVMWDLTAGLAAQGIDCDMLCAMLRRDPVDQEHAAACTETPEGRIIALGPHGRVICVPALAKKAATMISPAMISCPSFVFRRRFSFSPLRYIMRRFSTS